MMEPQQLEKRIANAVKLFWSTRNRQSEKQLKTGKKDQGSRGSATGGKQMDGFVGLIQEIIEKAGIPKDSVYCSTSIELPGFFRPEKKWDIIVVNQGVLVAALEFKSQIGPSFGNNFNNRSEEAIGSAQDIWTAFREGAFRTSDRPWLGFVMLLEDCEGSTRPVQVKQPHFEVFPEFRNASYTDRYKLLMNKLIRERLYDACAFLTSTRKLGVKGKWTEPDPSLNFERFASALSVRIITHLSINKKSTNA